MVSWTTTPAGPRWTHDRDRAARSPMRGTRLLRRAGARPAMKSTGGEEWSGREVGSQEATGGKCDFNGAGVMVPKRNREEGNTGSRGGSGKEEEAERRPVPCGGGGRSTRWCRPKEAAARA